MMRNRFRMSQCRRVSDHPNFIPAAASVSFAASSAPNRPAPCHCKIVCRNCRLADARSRGIGRKWRRRRAFSEQKTQPTRQTLGLPFQVSPSPESPGRGGGGGPWSQHSSHLVSGCFLLLLLPKFWCLKLVKSEPGWCCFVFLKVRRDHMWGRTMTYVGSQEGTTSPYTSTRWQRLVLF